MKYTSYPAYEDGTDRVFRNVGIQQSDAGEIPKRIHTKFYVLFNIAKSSSEEVLKSVLIVLIKVSSRFHSGLAAQYCEVLFC